jgi:hypothetical protein
MSIESLVLYLVGDNVLVVKLSGVSQLAIDTHTNTIILSYIMYPIYIIWPYIISIVYIYLKSLIFGINVLG